MRAVASIFRRLLLQPLVVMKNLRMSRGLPNVSLPARARRLLPWFAVAAGVLLVIHLYSRLRLFSLHCGQGSSWTCRALSPADYLRGDAKPLVDATKGMQGPSVFGGGAHGVLDDVTSALGDAYYAVADTIGSSPASWTHGSDADDVGMSRRQCMLAFPGLYAEIDRARSKYESVHIGKIDVERIAISEGRFRAAVFNGKLHVLETNLRGQKDRTRALAILRSINEATRKPQKRTPLPNIEFVVSVNPQVPDLTTPIWTPDRREDDDKVWLMPDMGYVVEEVETLNGAPVGSAAAADAPKRKAGSPSAHRRRGLKDLIGLGGDKSAATTPTPVHRDRVIATPRSQLVSDIAEMLPFEARLPRLVGVWRATQVPDSLRKQQLLHMSEGQDWAETIERDNKKELVGMEGTNGTATAEAAVAVPSEEAKQKEETETKKSKARGDDSSNSLHLTPLTDMCRYSFLAHDSSFPISVLDGPILCGSVLITTRPKWINIYHGLMLANPANLKLGDAIHPVVTGWGKKGAGRQNVVVVADDFGDLGMKVQGLLQYPEAARTIGENAVEDFRKRYLTPSATACYWRELIHAYARVAFKPKQYADGSGEVEIRSDDGQLAAKRSSLRGISVESFLLLDDDTQMSFNEGMMR